MTSEIALAVVSPTITPPIKPGPAEAATPSSRREIGTRLVEGGSNDVVERLDMGAGRDFRHHPAEGLMLLELGQDDVGADLALAAIVALDDGGGRLVASRLDSEYKHLEFLHKPAAFPLGHASA